ncbi:hypothetical protein PYCCODRAFT_578476 [Trametes coccinea BRFM310]|uniref:Uncharacterized protein n=1 Tax=Trametes coccinea (strain BRFM310) TaxID=1353009 RepID=A0A1Y2J2X3_TRAC3|nr:hypothetical protein PYCCODRAFT_578476 [Trametes coccinea BRFM310]
MHATARAILADAPTSASNRCSRQNKNGRNRADSVSQPVPSPTAQQSGCMRAHLAPRAENERIASAGTHHPRKY